MENSKKNKLINMNGLEDESYRYKMPSFIITQMGAGNGKYTQLNNIDNISSSINHPPHIICRYIASITGSSFTESTKQLTGWHDANTLNNLVIDYIKNLVLCPKCGIPETIPSVYGSKKNAGINLTCSACKTESKVIPKNKNVDKAIDIIVKYLVAGNTWTTTKGTLVEQENTNNPFDNNMVNFDDI